jgi:hypothetical protein
MRLAVDSVIALMLVGILTGICWQRVQSQHELADILSVQESMSVIMGQAVMKPAVGRAEAAATGHALRIEAEWFERPPENRLLAMESVAAPWIESAPHSLQNTFNPRRIVADDRHAAFWYNPYRSLIRARVPMRLSQQETVELYNLVNGTSLRVQDVDWPGGAEGKAEATTAGK